MRTYRIVICLGILLPLLAGAALAQEKAPEPERGPLVKVQIVISRYEQTPSGEKKTSSLPFTLLATANGDKASVRTGSQVPILSGTQGSGNFQFIDVGSNIDCNVRTAANGRFNIILVLQDRSLLEKPAALGSGATVVNQPVIRNFQYNNAILLKDGESKQFVAASDKGSGDIVKVDVTIFVEK